jgi:hypothetical protein
MLDKSLFEIAIEGNQATISYSRPSCRATVIWLSSQLPAVAGYVSHQVIETELDPRLEFVLSSPDINNCVDQAFVSLSG